MAAMCADSSPPNVVYLLSRTARLSSVKKSRIGGWEAKSRLLGVVPSPSFTVRRAFHVVGISGRQHEVRLLPGLVRAGVVRAPRPFHLPITFEGVAGDDDRRALGEADAEQMRAAAR